MNSLTQSLLSFLDRSTCNFLAARNIAEELQNAGFTRLDMRDAWSLRPGDRRYVVKNDSAIFAFVVGNRPEAGYKIISAHSDSPGFRIKPNAEMLTSSGVLKLNTEVYGGPILYTWFDRPLSISGRVILKGPDALHPRVELVRFTRPLLSIPHLAIHYNRAVNEGNPLSKQKDMLPVLAYLKDKSEKDGYLLRLVAKEIGVDPTEILDFDLTLFDTTPACLYGVNEEFISSGRIDDLMMAHAAMTALIQSLDTPPAATPEGAMTRVMAIFDNEETGSGTKQGAASPILKSILRRVNDALGGNEDTFLRSAAASFMISADNGHALHPNYEEKQDPTNHPVPGLGPVIKINANCKYMTDAESASVFRVVCQQAGVPCQTFVNHSDVAGGSTLGNILTSQIELRGVDMGAPQWAMHSCRESAAAADHIYTTAAFRHFYEL